MKNFYHVIVLMWMTVFLVLLPLLSLQIIINRYLIA